MGIIMMLVCLCIVVWHFSTGTDYTMILDFDSSDNAFLQCMFEEGEVCA